MFQGGPSYDVGRVKTEEKEANYSYENALELPATELSSNSQVRYRTSWYGILIRIYLPTGGPVPGSAGIAMYRTVPLPTQQVAVLSW